MAESCVETDNNPMSLVMAIRQKGKRARGQEGKDKREERKEREGTLFFVIQGFMNDGKLKQYTYYQNFTNVLTNDGGRDFRAQRQIDATPLFLTSFCFPSCPLALLPYCPIALTKRHWIIVCL
jgi:hypothetical protein